MRVCVHTGECMRVYMSVCVCTDAQKKTKNIFLNISKNYEKNINDKVNLKLLELGL